MYKDINDYELLYLISENDEAAYNSIYLKYSNIVKILSRRMYQKIKYLGISYEDIYQAGLYGLSKAIRDFDENEKVLFYTFASTYIFREIVVFVRDNGRNKHNVLSDSLSLNTEIDDDGNIMLDFIESKNNNISEYDENEKNLKLLEFKHELPFEHSLIYELKLNNFSNKEIVSLLDIKYKTLDNALRNIRNKFKKNLNKIEVL